MSDNLLAGNRCYFISPKSGLKLRCIVVESLGLRARGESRMIAVVRDIKPRKDRTNRIRLEGPIREPKVKMIDRDQLRKLPPRNPRTLGWKSHTDEGYTPGGQDYCKIACCPDDIRAEKLCEVLKP